MTEEKVAPLSYFLVQLFQADGHRLTTYASGKLFSRWLASIHNRDANDRGKTLPEEKQNLVRDLPEFWKLCSRMQDIVKGCSRSLSCTVPRICMFLLLQLLIKS
ncbi:unnamed protein product [Dovyalis caffra]|uniref:Uncharacterized protein n=1 Tax=Dovyalis caffra TaxID=77055 RepID=A0AAV1S5X4_9ROSI|nr:unnamed protein product [Dovyalis caffra]